MPRLTSHRPHSPAHLPHDPVTRQAADAVRGSAGFVRASAFLASDDSRTLREQAELTSIPAPPFGEAARGERMAGLMAEAGLADPRTDTEGNVVARHAPSGTRGGPPLVVAAHLDTVFPDGTPVQVIERDGRLVAPGIADDARGLAALLALSRALLAGELALEHPLLVIATVGEEGAGNLRGVRHLFSADGDLGGGCLGFVSLDGAGLARIVTRGLGSRRYRATVRGPGGHSWFDWGAGNPIHALGHAIHELTNLPMPGDPGATLSVGRWSGGTSINAIPREAWIEFEIRSEDAEVLAALERSAIAILERTPRGTEGDPPERALRLSVDGLGERPAGSTPLDAVLVRAAAEATRAVGAVPEAAVSSTDANIPMAAGVEAITMGAGGEAGMIHTPDEWYRNVRGPDGIVRALLTLLVADRLHAEGGR